MMGRRRADENPTNKMAVLMLLLLVCLLLALSHLPAATSASPPPLGGDHDRQLLFAKPNDTTTEAGAGAVAAATPSSTEQQDDDDKTKKKEQQNDKTKKELEEIEKLKQEGKGLVSFTNGTGSYKGMSREFLDGHNKARHRYGVPPMKWNNKLARHARRWSNAMRKDCQLKHSPGNNYGESVFASHKSTGWNATAMDAIWTWSSEEPLYDKLTGNCTAGRHFSECGHFSLMVDQRNQKIGCGRAECYSGGVFITCNYYLSDRDP